MQVLSVDAKDDVVRTYVGRCLVWSCVNNGYDDGTSIVSRE